MIRAVVVLPTPRTPVRIKAWATRPGRDRVREGAHDRFLPDQLGEGLRPVFAGENAIGVRRIAHVSNPGSRWETGSATQAATRYGCFLPDLTGLARGLPAAGLPRPLYQLSTTCGASFAADALLAKADVDFAEASIVVRIGGGDFARPPLRGDQRCPISSCCCTAPPAPPPTLPPEQAAAITKEYVGWGDRLRAEGRLKAGEKLTFDAGRVLRPKGGRVMTTDGPYAESKELLGGFFLIAAADYDEACRTAESCPHFKYGGSIEIRQIDPMNEVVHSRPIRSQTMPELQIIGAPQSNYVWVARIACTEKDVPYTLVPVLPHSPEVDAIHPFGKIPAMRHGDVTSCESRAISFYIDHAFAGPPLAPRDPVAGARTEQWISLVNTHIDPLLVRQYLGAYFFPGTPDGGPNRADDRQGLAADGAAFCSARSRRRQNRPPCRGQLYACRHQPAADPVLSRQTAGKPGDAAAGDGASTPTTTATWRGRASPKPPRRLSPAALRGKSRPEPETAMRYMLLIYSRETELAERSPQEMERLISAHWAVIDESRKQGVLLAVDPLHPTATATTIRRQGEKTMILDGPFAETKEQLAGYYILDCENLDEAIDWAKKIPTDCGGGEGCVEIRPIAELPSLKAIASGHAEPSPKSMPPRKPVFRREHGRIIASLIRLCGSFDRAEEAMQEAFAAALANWSAHGCRPIPPHGSRPPPIAS